MFDSTTNFLYLPDYNSSTGSGIWRYDWAGTVFDNQVNFFNLGVKNLSKPVALALGVDGSLYVTVAGSTNLYRVNNPGLATQATSIQAIIVGKTTTKGTALAFVGNVNGSDIDLWIAETGSAKIPASVTFIPGPNWRTCNTPASTPQCSAPTSVPAIQSAIVSPTSIAYDSVSKFAYVSVPASAGVGSGVWRFNTVTQVPEFYTAHWVKPGAPGTPGLYYDVTAIALDGLGNLYLIDDPTLGVAVGAATVYQVVLGLDPDTRTALTQPAFPPQPTQFLTATANPAWPYASGILGAPKGALWMGTHMWVLDSSRGFCKVDPTLGLTSCVGAGTSGQPAFDAVNSLLYIPVTAAVTTAACIQVYSFDPGAEALGAPATVATCTQLIKGAGGAPAKAPTALAFGPDSQLYVAMTGISGITRLTAPSLPSLPAGNHAFSVIGNVFTNGVKGLAFYKGDLYAVELGSITSMPAATLCQGICKVSPLVVNVATPVSVASDGNFVYVGDAAQVWKFDPAASQFFKLADTGTKAFGTIGGLAIDPQGQVYAADQGPVWQISAGAPTNLSFSPAQAVAGTTQTVTIVGANFLPGTTVTACPAITVSGVTVVNATTLTATFALSVSQFGACAISVVTPNGTNSANFTVLTDVPPVLLSIDIPSAARGGSGPNSVIVTITGTDLLGANLAGAPGVGVTAGTDITASIITNTVTQIVATFIIPATAALGPVNVIVTTPSGVSTTPLAFTIVAPVPTFKSINPALGPAGSTYLVTINGTGFLGSTLTLPPGITLLNGIQPVATQTSIGATLVFSPATVGATTNNQVVITVNTPGGPISASFTIVPQALLGIVSTHGTFTQGQTGTYTLAVSNAITSSATNGTVTVTETLPPGLNFLSMTGTGWTCVTNTCTRADALAGGASYPPITVLVNIHAASTPLVSNASASLVNSPTASMNDSTVILFPPPTLTGMTVAVGVVGSSVPVTFAGTNFTDAILTLPTGITTTGWVVDAAATHITVTLDINPIAPIGPQTITISTPLGGAVTGTFMVLPLAPQIASITPAQGVIGTSEPVIIAGTNLTGATLTLGAGITATGVVMTGTQITATLVIDPTASAGPVNITVTTTGGTNTTTFKVVPPPTPAAAFVKTDTTTQGAWKTVYGADGQAIANDVTNYPLYAAKVALTGQTPLTWLASTTDPSALMNGAGTGGIASSWYSATGFNIDINLTDGLPHQVALYCLDWVGNNTRTETIDVLDAATQRVLATTSMSSFTKGQYLVLNLNGHVTLRVTPTAGPDAVVSGLFFDGATGSVPPPVVTSIDIPVGVPQVPVTVTLTGTSLTGATLNLPAGVTATITGTPTDTQIVAALTIDATAPIGLKGISVTTPGGISTPIGFTILAQPLLSIGLSHGSFTQDQAGTYTVTVSNGANLGPTRGPVTVTETLPAGLTLVSMTGLNWTCLTNGNTCTRNDALAGGASYDSITVIVNVSALTSPLVNNVSVSGGASIAAANSDPTVINFVAPTLTSVSPSFSVIGTAPVVTFTGSHLTGATLSLPLGITATSLAVTNPSQIVATLNITPSPALVGLQRITINTPGGNSTGGTFNVLPFVPVLTAITPATGAVGTHVSVTLTGTSLATASSIQVTPGVGITATLGVAGNDNQITADLAIAAGTPLGPQSITITTAGGTTTAVTLDVIPAGLVAGYWLAGIPTGSAAVPNVVSGGPALTLSNNPTIGATGIALNATLHQYGTIAGVALPETMTVITVSDTTNNSTFVEQGPNTATTDGFYLYGAGLSSFAARRSPLQSTMPLSSNWEGTGPVMLGATFDGTHMIAYRNGAAFRNSTVPPMAGIATNTVYVGSRAGTGLFMNGTMRFVGIWNRTLSATEIASVYQSLKTEFAGLGVTLPVPPPTLAAIAPLTGVIGTSVPVTLTGVNLTGASLNLPAGITATMGLITDTQINATLALSAPLGPQSITVTTAGGTSAAVTFTVLPLTPALTNIAPATGVIGTTVALTLTGTDLTGATLNPAAGITITGVVASASQITANLAIAVTAALGSRSITVTTAGGTSQPVTFTILPPAPKLTGIAPSVGGIGTSAAVTITGTNLTGSTLNLPAGITATIGAITDTQINATLALSAPLGPQSITVTTAGGVSKAATFTVVLLTPTLATVAPATGAVGNSVAVTLIGTNLTGATLGLSAGLTASNLSVTDTQITATLAIAATAGLGQSITVTTPIGVSNTLAFAAIPDGLVAGYRLIGVPTVSTAVANIVSGGPALTLINSPTIGATGIALNATLRQYGTIAGVTLPETMTVITVGDTANNSTFVEHGTSTATTDGFYFYGAGLSSFGVRRGAVEPVMPLSSNWEGVGPVMLGATFDGATMSTYRNGAAFRTAAVTHAAGIVTNTVYVGSRAGTGLFMNGTIRFVGIWNRTLSATEIATVYQSLRTDFAGAGVVLPPLPPTLAAIGPLTGVIGTSVPVTLTGVNLTGASLNLPAGITATMGLITDTQINATLALSAPLGPQSITVTTAGGTSAAVTFTVLPLTPTLTTIAPLTGVTGTTVALTLTGTDLTGATLNPGAGITATGVIASATQITANLAIAATAAQGPRNITVTTTGGATNLTFTVNPPTPALTTIAPLTGVIGTNVALTLTGTNLTGATLNPGAGITATGVIASATQITASLAIAVTAAQGPRSITVTTTGGAANLTFTVNPPTPALTTIAPLTGVIGTNVALTLTGTNLTGATLNPGAGITATGVIASATQITASLAIAVTAAQGPRSIAVTTAGGATNLTFTVNPPTPVLTGIAPNVGAVGSSVAVTITGTNLTGSTLNLPAGITATIGAITDTQINATLALSAPLGPQSITVTTAGGASKAVTFTVVLLTPTLATVAPATGAVGNSVVVTLIGTNLTGATLGLSPGLTASNLSVTDTQITATLAIAATAGLGQSITVTTPIGVSNTLPFAAIPDGLVAGYRLIGVPTVATAVANIVSGGPALTLFNKPTIGPTGIALNATLRQYGTIAGVTLPETMTVITVGDTANNSTFVEQGPNTGTTDGFYFYGAGLSSFGVRRGTLEPIMPLSSNWEGVGPVMLGATFDGATMSTYRNGVVFRTAAVTHEAGIVTNTVYVGSRAGTGLFMNGTIRFVGIWNRTLSAAEIAAVYQSLKTDFAGVGVTLP